MLLKKFFDLPNKLIPSILYSVAGIWIPNFAWLGIIAEVGPAQRAVVMSCVNCIARHTFHKQGFTFTIYNFGSVIEGFVEVVVRCHVTVLPKVEEECSRGSAPVTRNPSKYSSGRNSVVECSICPWHNVIPQSSHSENLEILWFRMTKGCSSRPQLHFYL